MKKPEELSEFIKSFKNVTFYQTMTWGGSIVKNGLRGIERRSFIDLSNINGKSILDVGCATGAEMLWAIENGAISATGIDNQLKTDVVNDIAKFLNIPIKGIDFDLDNGLPEEIKNTKFDTAFLFSITHNIKYKNIWEDIDADVIYFETGADSGMNEKKLSGKKYKATQIGETPGSYASPRICRKVFIMNRNK